MNLPSFPIFLLSFFSNFSSFPFFHSFTLSLPSWRSVRPCMSFVPSPLFFSHQLSFSFVSPKFVPCLRPPRIAHRPAHMLHYTPAHTHVVSWTPFPTCVPSCPVFLCVIVPLCLCFSIRSLHCFGAALRRRGGVSSHARHRMFFANNPENLLGEENHR